ncbi:MAG: hypothetical protein KME43_21335 [Myxacorys chilensis ATA2-1-KO14]|jgi:hypothetical protein|nr:hypothetical protein [Myxacorys chilensis ATA2-1-KO14]
MQTIIRAESFALSYQRIHSLLVCALADLSYWQDAKNQHRTGTIALTPDSNGQWVVTASSDLVDKIIPF